MRISRAIPVDVDGTSLPAITWEGVALGVAVVLGGYVVGRGIGWMVGGLLLWRGRSPSASAMFSSLARWIVVLLSFAATVTIVFPSVQPVNALGAIGILSIAAGTVTAVSLTSTTVRTFDGRQVHVPNAVVHSEVVTVQTGFEHVRSM